MSVPPPSACSATTVPPCVSATWRTIASPRPGARACPAPTSRGRSGRRRAGRSASAIPGPWSRTVSSPSRSATSTSRPAGSTCRVVEQVDDRALEPRRARRSTVVGSSSSAKATSGRVALRAGSTASRRRARRGGRSSASVGRSSPRASSTSSATSDVISSSCATTSRSRRSRSSGRQPVGRAASTSMFVRRLVSGVRSSCEASATSCRWRCCAESLERVEHRVEADAPSRPSSSSPRRPAIRCAEVARLGDVLGRRASTAAPAPAPPGRRRAEQRARSASRRAATSSEQQRAAGRAAWSTLGQRPRELQRERRPAHRDRQHAPKCAPANVGSRVALPRPAARRRRGLVRSPPARPGRRAARARR